MKISAIICAAGKGERANLGKNKLLYPLYGQPVLYHTLKKFSGVDEIIVTASPADMAQVTAICAPFGARIVEGGETRQQSVYNALKKVTGEVVLIHDGARPYVTEKIISDCIDCVKKYRSAVCALPFTDTAVLADDYTVSGTPDRNKLFTVQTPQGFYTDDIKTAYEKAEKDNKTFTDDGGIYSEYISPAHLFSGEAVNKKLTYKSDFDGQYPPFNAHFGQAVGIGVDVHAFGKDCPFVTLCGVEIPCDMGLISHSDGDVALHAVTDALLSAAGLKDIGHYFPDTDPQFKDADSLQLLKKAVELVKEKGFAPANISLTIQAEKPRLSAHIEKMTANLAAACGLNISAVAVAAGTCEGLGFVGEGLGICATAIALLTKTH